jgi:predicted RNase H-like nuclease (RuvC/YqgF family)
MPDNSDRLAKAAQAKHAAALQRAQEALRHLDRTGQAITFAAVAQAASVSRSWLYRQPALRTQIQRLRATQQPHSHRQVAAAQRATTESLKRRIEAIQQETSRLRQENRDLRDQLARRLGADRHAALGGEHLR